MVPDEILSYILSMEINSNHPLAKAIVKYGNENNINILDVDDFQNFTGKGLKGIINSHEVIVGNKTLLEDNNIEISKGFISKYENIIKSKIVIFLAIGNNLCGILTLTDKIKDNSKNTISKLQSMGITSYMLTGDNSTNAKNVADEVGIDNVYCNILPNEKLDKIEEIQTKYNGKVLFGHPKYENAPKKSIEQVAKEVMAGKWGNGEERKKRLTEGGYDYEEVRKMVNKLCEIKVK